MVLEAPGSSEDREELRQPEPCSLELRASVTLLAVTVAASRIGALDMAIGNLLGSNLFDMMIVAVDDIFFLNGPILSHVSPLHVVSAMMMTGLTVVGLLYRPKTRVFWRVGWTSLALLTLYMLNALVLFLYER
jgi:cation:H+ antiporter